MTVKWTHTTRTRHHGIMKDPTGKRGNLCLTANDNGIWSVSYSKEGRVVFWHSDDHGANARDMEGAKDAALNFVKGLK